MATASIRTPLLRPSLSESRALTWARAALFALAFALAVTREVGGLADAAAGALVGPAVRLGGAPLHDLVAKFFALLPFGEVATRLALLSALCGAAAAVGLAGLTYRFFQRRLFAWGAGACAALLWLAAPATFAAASAPSLSMPCALVTILILHAVADLLAGERRAGLLLALYGGLSLGLAVPLAFMVMPPLVLYALAKLQRGARWPLYAVPLFVVGAAVRLCARESVSWLAFARHSALELRACVAPFFALRVDRAHVDFFSRTFLSQLETQLQLPALFVAGFGVYALQKQQVRARYLLLLSLLLSALDAMLTRAPGPLLLLFVTMYAGAGIAGIAQRLIGDVAAGYRQRLQLALGASVGMFVCTPALVAWSARAPQTSVARLAAAAVDAPQSRALVVTQSATLAGAMAYERDIAGARPDLTVIDRQDMSERALALRLGENLLRASVWWEPGRDVLAIGHPIAHVPLYEIRLTRAPLLPVAKVAAEAAWILQDARTSDYVGQSLARTGRVYAAQGQTDAAYALYHSALALAPDDIDASLDLATLLSRRGALYAALYRINIALGLDPFNESAQLLSGRYRLLLGDLGVAELNFRAAFLHHPSAPPLIGLARVAQRRGRVQLAHQLLVEALRADPKNEEARLLQGELRP